MSLLPTLPNEIWDRIFSLLTSRKDVGACRLTCRSFKDLSSPYLITRVCFALRMDTLNQLYDVMEHPFFHQHVTELVYDTSEYDDSIEDPREYGEARVHSELIFESESTHHQTMPRADLFRRVLEHPFLSDEEEEAAAAFLDPNLPISESEDVSNPNEYIIPAKYYYGLVEYSERRSEQQSLMAANASYTIVRQALSTFPRITHIIYGDYRNMARDGEDYQTCCTRLFGKNMLPPRIWSDPPYITATNETVTLPGIAWKWIELFCLIRNTGVSHKLPHTLTIGSNEFSNPAGLCTPCGKSSKGLAPLYLRSFESFDHTWPEKLLGFEGLRGLSLPIVIGDRETNPDEEATGSLGTESGRFKLSPLKLLFDSVASNLRCLNFGAVDLMRPVPRDGMQNITSELGPFRLATTEWGQNALRRLLFPVQFPALKHLILVGWSIPPTWFVRFLSQMKHTLEFLELKNNIIQGTSQDQVKLATQGGKLMLLKGVVIDNYEKWESVHGKDSLNEESDPQLKYDVAGRDHKCEGLWVGGRKNMLGNSD